MSECKVQVSVIQQNRSTPTSVIHWLAVTCTLHPDPRVHILLTRRLKTWKTRTQACKFRLVNQCIAPNIQKSAAYFQNVPTFQELLNEATWRWCEPTCLCLEPLFCSKGEENRLRLHSQHHLQRLFLVHFDGWKNCLLQVITERITYWLEESFLECRYLAHSFT